MNLLEIKNLKVNIGKFEVLKGASLSIEAGKTHVVMGPNGSGKSSLANTIIGHPMYKVVGGEVLFEEDSILEMAPEERSLLGIFLSFQTPVAVPGVTVSSFLRMAYNQRFDEEISPVEFQTILLREIKEVGLDKDFLYRSLNEGFSGGEKKKLEMLQMRILKPRFIILDEIDSGLDVDALKLVAKTVESLRDENSGISILIVTHQRKLLEHINPDRVHIMVDGKIVKSDGKELVDLVENEGYEGFR